MKEISLEKVDLVIERTGVSYAKGKEALAATNGDVLEAIIYIENQTNNENTSNNENAKANSKINGETIEEFKTWLKELINKGNVTRIKIKKDEKELVDVPVNAGVAATVIAVILPPVLAVCVIAAVATQITIEITKADGTCEVVNKYVSKAANEVKDKATILAENIKSKFKDLSNVKNERGNKGEDTVYSYTVKFDEDKENR
jgi:hypothetical protein